MDSVKLEALFIRANTLSATQIEQQSQIRNKVNAKFDQFRTMALTVDGVNENRCTRLNCQFTTR